MKCLNLFFSKNETFKYRKNTFKSLFIKVFEVKKKNLDFVILCQAHGENVCLTHGGVFVNVWHMFTNFFLLFMCVCACVRAFP